MSAKAGVRSLKRSTKGLAVAVLALIAIVVVVAISRSGGAPNDPGKPDADVSTRLSSAKLGFTEPQVRQIFGEPDMTRQSESDGVRVDTWSYRELSTKFVFENGRLKAKSRS
jgi:hypothetical protein